MKPIGSPQFPNPSTQAAYTVLSNATGTAEDLTLLQDIASKAKGEARSQIGDLIEAFIVRFGFPSDDGIRGDAEPLLPDGKGLSREEVSRIVRDLETQEQIDAFLATVVLEEADEETQATVDALLTAAPTEEDGIALLMGLTVAGAAMVALFADGRYQTLTVDVPPGWGDLDPTERRGRAAKAIEGAKRSPVEFDALAEYRDALDAHYRNVTRGYGEALSNGDIDLGQYHQLMVDAVIEAHTVQRRLGEGPLTPEAIEELQATLDEQLGYLADMVDQIAAGSLSGAQIAERSGRYGSNGGLSFNQGLAAAAFIAGASYEQRFLGACSPHCADCVEYAARGRQPIGTLPAPRMACACRDNCCCRLEFFTLGGGSWGWIG
jgi:hypothetical protein